MNPRNLAGFMLLTLLLLYYVLFTLAEGYPVAWYASIGVLMYLASAWLLLVPPKTTRDVSIAVK